MPSAKSSVGTATSIKTQVLPPVIKEFQGNDPLDILFPVWSDQEINTEKWEPLKAKTTPELSKSPRSTKTSELPSGNIFQENVFFDPHHISLPPNFKEYLWKRPKEIYSNARFVIYTSIWDYSDLISANKHLLHNEFMRSFISAIGILEYLGFTNPWNTEASGSGYIPNTESKPWRAWFHIYSLCKAGKGQKHTPEINTMGKYAVRLYWMGFWRKIMVDDLLPVDSSNKILLPATHTFINTPGESKYEEESMKTIEMWPFLLCKALMKIASLTWNENKDLVDCDIISLLTGWMVQQVNTSDLKFNDIWDMCAAYSNHFSWPVNNSDTEASQKSKKSKKDKVSNTKSNVNTDLPYCLLGSFPDMRNVCEKNLQDFSPCWSHNFLIDQSRDIPLAKPAQKEELARWKRFRWLAWAIKKGIYVEDNYDLNKCLKIFSVFRKSSENIIHNEESVIALDMKQSAQIIEEIFNESSKSKKEKETNEKNKDIKSKIAKDKGKKSTLQIPEDPSIWGDFNTLQPYISHLYIYTKPSQFASNIKISDFGDKKNDHVRAEKKLKGISPEFIVNKKFIWPNKLTSSRNEPFHLFMDSLDFKFVMINLSQVGNKNILLPINFNEEKFHSDVEKPISHVVIEKYNWQNEQIGDMSVSINTFGSKSVLLQIKPGRNCLRLWIKSESSFIIHIVSDIYLSAGTQDAVYQYMQNESRILLQMCFDIGSNFGKIIHSFGSDDFIEKSITFHASYKPENVITKVESKLIEREFCKELLNLVLDKYSINHIHIIRAVKILMLDFNSQTYLTNNNNNLNNPPLIMFDCEDKSSNDSFTTEKLRQNSATKIQAFFKMVYIKQLLASRQQSHSKYLKTYDTLKMIYKDLFSVENRIVSISTILRKLLLDNRNLLYVREYYQLYHDLQSVVDFQVSSGLLSVESNNWVPIGRYIFYVNSIDPVFVKLCIQCDIELYYLRIFNNDNGHEIERFTVNANVGKFGKNVKGYSVLIYGWSEESLIVHTKFYIISIKKDVKTSIIVPEKEINQIILCDVYNPNINNLIGKCKIFISQDCIVSFRFSCSLSTVKVRLRCVDQMGQVCAETIGIGNLILALADLKYVPNQEQEIIFDYKKKESKLSASRSRSAGSKGNFVTKKKKRNSESGSIRSSALSFRESGRYVSDKNGPLHSIYYIVEIFVLEDTWPLCISEWLRVDNVRKKNLIGPKIFPDLFPPDSVDASYEDEEKNINRNKPTWCIQTICNKTDEIFVIVDNRRQKEIDNIKLSWFEGNEERYERGEELRNTYLESQYIKTITSESNVEWQLQKSYSNDISNRLEEQKNEYMNEETYIPLETYSFKSLSNVEKITVLQTHSKTLTKPTPTTKMLPPLDYSQFATYDRNLYLESDITCNKDMDIILSLGKVKTEEDVARDDKNLEKEKYLFEKSLQIYADAMHEMRLKELRQNIQIHNWYQECRRESDDLVKSGYQMKDIYIKHLLTESPRKTVPSKGKKKIKK